MVTRTVVTRSHGVAFGVVDLDHPVPIVIEDTGVEQFVLGVLPAAGRVRRI